MNHVITLLKYALIGFLGGAVVVALVAIIISGPSSFHLKEFQLVGYGKTVGAWHSSVFNCARSVVWSRTRAHRRAN